ncbi:MAG: ester cyclase, partial [Actinobacteria bacterium]|nr:ester cyclase [Actinomycetota bacterium]
FWAARGAGPGFFGVATRFHVRVYPLPNVIRSSTHLYPLSEVERVSAWAAVVAPTLPATVELLLVLASAPPGAGAGPAGKMIVVTATAFADTEREAEQALAPLESCPSVGRALRRAINQPTSFDDLFETIDGLAPEGHRYAEDALWSDDDLGALLPRLAEHLVTAPSARSVVIASTAPAAAAIEMPDAAFSMVARTFVLPYAIWDHEADDDRNETWLREAVQSIEDRTVGHYVAEADLAAGPSRSTRSFAPENWERLGALKRRHDPDNVFHSYLGLEEAPMATVTDNGTLVRRLWAAVFNDGDVEIIDELVDEAFSNFGEPVNGPRFLRELVTAQHTAFPDTHFALDQELCADDWVICRVTWTGTFKGNFPHLGLDGIEPTGRSFSTRHVHLFRLRDRKIVEHWAVRDDLGMLTQLGVLSQIAG